MQLFGLLHLALLGGILAIAFALSLLNRRGLVPSKPLRLALGYALGVNELIWWAFRYSHEGFRFPVNLPLQLCDVTLWMTVLACVTLSRLVVEFAYFAGIAGAGMALITPDLWTPWPSYPAIYFFVAHGLIVIGIAVLVFGRIVHLRSGAPWRAFGMLIAYGVLVGVFNAIFGTNYMYVCRKPGGASLLDAMGPWPMYLVGGAALGLGIFWLLWIPVRPKRVA